MAQWRRELEEGASLDCLDDACLWWTAKVTGVDNNRLKVRYDGFDERWDEWIDRASPRLAPWQTRAKGGKDTHGVKVQLEVVGERDGLKMYKKGFLTKQGGRFKTFRNRFFVLLEDGTMQYYKQMSDRKPAGKFNIMHMTETRIVEYPDKQLSGFEIVTPQRTWRFQCSSDSEVNDWISVIHAISSGLRPDEEEEDLGAVLYEGYTPPKKFGDLARKEKRLSITGMYEPNISSSTSSKLAPSPKIRHRKRRSSFSGSLSGGLSGGSLSKSDYALQRRKRTNSLSVSGGGGGRLRERSRSFAGISMQGMGADGGASWASINDSISSVAAYESSKDLQGNEMVVSGHALYRPAVSIQLDCSTHPPIHRASFRHYLSLNSYSPTQHSDEEDYNMNEPPPLLVPSGSVNNTGGMLCSFSFFFSKARDLLRTAEDV